MESVLSRSHCFILAALLAASSAAPTLAHDFWLQSDDLRMDAPGTASVEVRMGHADAPEHWPVSSHRVFALRSLSRLGHTDHQQHTAFYSTRESLPVRLGSTGLNILSIETTEATSELPAVKFQSYAEDEGLSLVLDDRSRRGLETDRGVERYSRRGKALIQVGPVTAEDTALATRPLGMTLEIVPLQYPVNQNKPFDAAVFYRGQPLEGVQIKSARLGDEVSDHHAADARFISDANGRVTIRFENDGAHMLHAVWSTPRSTDDGRLYDTVFSSLTFAVGTSE